MNFVITTACSLDCSYCFAHSRRLGLSAQEMSLAELEKLISGLDPEHDTVRLMGGEPTLHSQYPEILKLVKEHGFQVVVFTNGLHAILRNTAPQLPDQILLNLNDWSSYSSLQRAAIQANLKALGDRIGLAYTILRPEFDLSHHQRLIMEYGLQPMIRLGLAHPVIGGDNAYLPDTDLADVHHSVVQWAVWLSREQIRLGFDCGFMRCHFNDGEIETLIRAGTVLNFSCAPTLDVGPGLITWRCFAFSACEENPCQAYENEASLLNWYKEKDYSLSHNSIDLEPQLIDKYVDGCLARRLIHLKHE